MPFLIIIEFQAKNPKIMDVPHIPLNKWNVPKLKELHPLSVYPNNIYSLMIKIEFQTKNPKIKDIPYFR